MTFIALRDELWRFKSLAIFLFRVQAIAYIACSSRSLISKISVQCLIHFSIHQFIFVCIETLYVQVCFISFESFICRQFGTMLRLKVRLNDFLVGILLLFAKEKIFMCLIHWFLTITSVIIFSELLFLTHIMEWTQPKYGTIFLLLEIRWTDSYKLFSQTNVQVMETSFDYLTFLID